MTNSWLRTGGKRRRRKRRRRKRESGYCINKFNSRSLRTASNTQVSPRGGGPGTRVWGVRADGLRQVFHCFPNRSFSHYTEMPSFMARMAPSVSYISMTPVRQEGPGSVPMCCRTCANTQRSHCWSLSDDSL